MKNNHKLIMENWRNYVAQEAMVSIAKTDVNSTKIFLSEGKQVKEITFGNLMEQHKSGKLSTDKLVRLWEQSMDYEFNLLVEANILSLIQQGYENVKTGAVKAWNTVSDAVKAAWSKATSFLVNITKQTLQLMDGGLVKAGIAYDRFKEKVDQFGDAHPRVVDAAKILGLLALMAALNAAGVDASDASASIVDAKGNVMTTPESQMVLGKIQDGISQVSSIDAKAAMMQEFQSVKAAIASGAEVPVSEIGRFAEKAVELVRDNQNHLEAAIELRDEASAAGEMQKVTYFANEAEMVAKEMMRLQKIGANAQDVASTTRGGAGF